MIRMTLLDNILPQYKKVFWIKNYAKTVTASTLIASGIGLIVTGKLERMEAIGYGNSEITLGAICLLLALIITFILDYWASKKDKQLIQDIDNYIDKRAEEIAKDKILEAMNKLE